ncbi:hypothetical protein [Cupriavidus necator]|uniref:hypothetical protein n=1 Tax=Cupriavidus necator TaxID=106590 RepID=UPI000ADA4744|nr:hypothetical protein [Cupriavidus necator]
MAVTDAARQRGIVVRPLSRYFIGDKVQRGLLVGYACVPEEDIGPSFDVLLGCLQ